MDAATLETYNKTQNYNSKYVKIKVYKFINKKTQISIYTNLSLLHISIKMC